MQKIKSLKELLEELPKCKGTQFNDLAKDLILDPKEFKPYMFFNEKHYTRNCIIREEDFELILLCWNKDQKTSIHCHGGEECWVYMLDGEMKEIRYISEDGIHLEKVEEKPLKQYDIAYINDSMGYHSLHNTASGKSMSLHLYMNPIKKCTGYNKELEKFVSRKMSDYSYAGKILDSSES